MFRNGSLVRVPQKREHIKNNLEQIVIYSKACLRPRHLAGGIISPIAVEPDHAPFHAPGNPDHAGVLADRVMHGVPAAVADHGNCGTEPARYCLGCPGAKGRLPHRVEPDDLQVGIPEIDLLSRKSARRSYRVRLRRAAKRRRSAARSGRGPFPAIPPHWLAPACQRQSKDAIKSDRRPRNPAIISKLPELFAIVA